MKVVLAEQACVLWNLSKVAGIKIGVLLKDTVVWPVLIWTYDTALSPLVLILKDKFKIVEDNILIYFLAPVCQTVVNIVPDKSPFVDDSDVEFEDFVPLANDGNDSDASWDPEEANRERKRQEEAKTAKAQAKPQTALFEFPDFNELGSSDEEFMLE
uniref:FACT complex subunit n=1 Tax=Rhabditophanes sp. KR3021 TaxID=114890 RepID=A0AC35U1W3_9BILA